MKAIGYTKSLPITDEGALQAFDIPTPEPGARDLLVEVKAVSVNPVDVKVRTGVDPAGETKVLGWDASGIVRATGADVTCFKPGDEVFYAGALDRPGTNSELHVVDERIVGRKPSRLSHAEAAALPLTTITAWELLFDRFGIAEGGGAGDTLLAIGGAGGVGSILIQLARALTGLTVVATASRPETRAWVEAMGAHHVIDHRGDMPAQMKALGLVPRYVAGLTGTEHHFPAIAEMLAPQGRFGLVDDPDPKAVDVMLLKHKAISLHWEFMFTRSLFATHDMIEQHRLLSRVADLVDAGRIRTTANHDGGTMTPHTLRAAHQLQESGRAIGKTTLTW
ncbi:zinc-binding alcohol dehydrogenase family protein [Stappia sp.]|uniref:zinc-binding alcohol dehydrogenase family protein n=1 Tax=Stappia sp. TaxID=1870903 RepID=UPI0032D99C5A